MAMTDLGDAEYEIIGITISGAALSLYQNDTKTFLSTKESAKDIKHKAYMQSVLS